jgi:hypothetical protein
VEAAALSITPATTALPPAARAACCRAASTIGCRNWYFNADVKSLWINNDVRLNNVNFGNSNSLDLDPWMFGVGVRYRF